MRVLVAGATGFVASHLVPALVAGGHDAVALGHDESRLPQGEQIEAVVADLRAPLEADVLPPFDAVVQLAQANIPLPDGARDLVRVNTVSTVELLDAARVHGAERFIFASSGSVYGPRDEPVDEDDPLDGGDFYSTTKRSAELAVRAFGAYFHTSILRLFTPYGPGQRNRLVPGLIERVRDAAPIMLRDGGRPRLTPIYVDDVVAVVLRALATDDDHVLNVAGDETVSIRELAELIGGVLGREPRFDDAPGAAAGDLVARNERMHAVLGERRLVTLAEGIAATANA